MNELTLEWQEAGQPKNYTINDRQPSKNPGKVRLGREPAQCDIVLGHETVSRLHVEIFFNQQLDSFYLRNLQPNNPPAVDGKSVVQGEVALSQGSTIELGQMKLVVRAVSQAQTGVAPTILMPPKASVQGSSLTYGLQCPHCDRISPYERLDLGCPWCGTSLAAAASVLMSPT